MRSLLIVGTLSLWGLTSQAATITYNYSSGSSAGGEAVNASAAFAVNTGTNQFTVMLNNLQSARDVGQLITDFEFSLPSGTVSYLGPTGTTTFETVNKDGSTSTMNTGTVTWGFGTMAGGVNVICTACPFTQRADNAIIGPIASNVNGSIAGNNGHNPFILGPETFSFTSGSYIFQDIATSPFSNVTFSFGTQFGAANSPGTFTGSGTPSGGQTPEPVSCLLTGGGLIGLACLRRRRTLA